MRAPDFDIDGWCLEDGESRHREAPSTFSIPSQAARDGLQQGDLAKLIFSISVDNPIEPVVVERMWVIVRERIDEGYLGLLDNEPSSISENDEFWPGIELPFEARHVIAIKVRNAKTIALAQEPPTRRWTEN